MGAVFRFVTKHFFATKFGPMFRLVFPIILLLFLGEISVITKYNNINFDAENAGVLLDNVGASLRSVTSGVIASSTFIIAFNNFPSSLASFKDSVILKRISATRITKLQFFFATLSFYMLLVVFTFFYVMLVSGLLVATRLNRMDNPWQYVLPIESGLGEAMGFFFLSVVTFLLFGLMLGSILKRVRTIGMVSGIIQFPTTLIIGGLISSDLVSNSEILNGIRYLFLHSQPAVGMTTFWRYGTMEQVDIIVSVVAAFAIMIVCSIIIWKKFKWTD